MKSRSAKNKGARLQNEVRKTLLEAFPELPEDSIKCAIMGESGVDLIIHSSARKLLPLSIEAKNQERLNIWQAIEQAKQNQIEDTEWVVFFKRNRSEIFTCISQDFFVYLLRNLNQTKKDNGSKK